MLQEKQINSYTLTIIHSRDKSNSNRVVEYNFFNLLKYKYFLFAASFYITVSTSHHFRGPKKSGPCSQPPVPAKF